MRFREIFFNGISLVDQKIILVRDEHYQSIGMHNVLSTNCVLKWLSLTVTR